jgi:hypothetical protein
LIFARPIAQPSHRAPKVTPQHSLVTRSLDRTQSPRHDRSRSSSIPPERGIKRSLSYSVFKEPLRRGSRRREADSKGNPPRPSTALCAPLDHFSIRPAMPPNHSPFRHDRSDERCL